MFTLPNLFIPKRKFFGLSLGRTVIRGVETDETGQIALLSEVPIPEGTFQEGVLQNKDSFSAALNNLLARGNFTTPYVAVCFPEVYAYSRELVLPQIPKSDLAEAVSWRVKNLFPFPPEEIYTDFKLLGQKDSEYKISVVAARRQVIDPLVAILQSVGLKPISFEPGSSIISNLLNLRPDQCALVIDINRTITYITLVAENKSVFTTIVNFTPPDTAQTYLKNIQQALTEISSYYQKKGVLKNNATTIITGELARDDWARAIASQVPYPTQILKLAPNPAFNKAYAAAVSKIAPPDDENTINILPLDLQSAYNNERRSLFYNSLLTQLGLILFILNIISLSVFITIKLESGKFERKTETLSQFIDSQTSKHRQLLQLNTNAKNIVNLAPLRTTPKNYIASLASLIPPGISVSKWDFDDAKQLFSITGVAQDRSDLLKLKNSLENEGSFAKVTLPLESLESSTNTKFTLSFIIKK